MTNSSWVCNKCSETIEMEFDTCWKCGGSPDKKNLLERKIILDQKENIDQEKEEIKKERIDEIKDYYPLKSFQSILFFLIFLNIITGIFTVIMVGLIGLVSIIPLGISIYIMIGVSRMVDFSFFLNEKIDNLKDEIINS